MFLLIKDFVFKIRNNSYINFTEIHKIEKQTFVLTVFDKPLKIKKNLSELCVKKITANQKIYKTR